MPLYDVLITEMYQSLIGELTREPSVTQMVKCCFHPDGTPSMKLDVDKNEAFCFACRKAWNPEQFEAAVRGEDEHGKTQRNVGVEMVDTFEKQILQKIRNAGRKPIEFPKVFLALDLARASTDGVKYDDLQRINKAIDVLLRK